MFLFERILQQSSISLTIKRQNAGKDMSSTSTMVYLRIVAVFTSIAIFCWVGSGMLFCPWIISFAKDM
jgi:hypothetical protein